MTKKNLHTLKSATTWGGVVITFSGILVNLASGGSWQGNSLSFAGLVITCCGHWIAGALAKHQAAERDADEQRFEDLEYRFRTSEEERDSMSEFLNRAGVFDNPNTLKRIIREERLRYDVEHQDDGR
ncbi:MAG: hypothetical protein ABSD29_05665 [Verrucomicrobiota bacterium]